MAALSSWSDTPIYINRAGGKPLAADGRGWGMGSKTIKTKEGVLLRHPLIFIT
jgi:hypothetical protein